MKKLLNLFKKESKKMYRVVVTAYIGKFADEMITYRTGAADFETAKKIADSINKNYKNGFAEVYAA